MSEDLEAIYDELRRLQKEGVGHVFIDDSTNDLLKPAKEVSLPRKRGAPVEHSILADLIKKPAAPEAKPQDTVDVELKSEALPAPPTLIIPDNDQEAQISWLKERILSCTTCNAEKSADEKLVFGDGSSQADLLFCGDAPGTDEASMGAPFVGSAGQLLDKIIKAMGLSRKDVYCTYLLKWRPKNDKPYGNRPPTEEETNFCLPYFRAEIEIIQPKVIIALGNNAVNGLLGHDSKRKMAEVRGTWSVFQDVPVLITFNPSYLLRNDTLKTKRMLWEDLLSAMEKIELPISEKQKGFFLPK
ncbi:MAG: uracil-DNA glycosylase [Opitutaceae bacterium]